MLPLFIGPYTVIGLDNEGLTVELKDEKSGDHITRHAQHVRRIPNKENVREDNEYVIDEIIERDGDYYKIRWEGYPEEEWIHLDDFGNTTKLLEE